MQLSDLLNTNVLGSVPVPTAEEIRKLIPASQQSLEITYQARQLIQRILDNQDKRLFVVVGPCSIHDPKAAIEYAQRLRALADEVKDTLFLIMRVYFEKPRTTVGWKGLINDPHLDDSFQIEEGLKLARKLLVDITALGLPTATEALDPVTPQYFSELLAWSAIGARTTESQTHREMASGLSMPVGFKNGTDGGVEVAINAMKSALSPHHFLGVDATGRIARYQTRGNPYSHIVLRGGSKGPNYQAEAISACEHTLQKAKLRDKIMVDCSHDNSGKDHRKQPEVFRNCIEQIVAGNRAICGFMLESHLQAGSQSIPADIKQLQYGVSITDKCMDWATTEALLRDAHAALLKKQA